MLLFLLACERDPVVYGYWDVIRWTVGEGEGAVEQLDAGNVEFTADDTAIFVLSYFYENGELVPDAHPNAATVGAPMEHRNEDEDQMLPSYRSEDERYFLNMYGYYEILDWTGGTMLLHANKAAPYGTWEEIGITSMGNYAPTTELPVELELVR